MPYDVMGQQGRSKALIWCAGVAQTPHPSSRSRPGPPTNQPTLDMRATDCLTQLRLRPRRQSRALVLSGSVSLRQPIRLGLLLSGKFLDPFQGLLVFSKNEFSQFVINDTIVDFFLQQISICYIM